MGDLIERLKRYGRVTGEYRTQLHEDAALAADQLEQWRPIVEAARALTKGQDWNKGTMALRHGYRQKLVDAVDALQQPTKSDDLTIKHASPVEVSGQRDCEYPDCPCSEGMCAMKESPAVTYDELVERTWNEPKLTPVSTKDCGAELSRANRAIPDHYRAGWDAATAFHNGTGQHPNDALFAYLEEFHRNQFSQGNVLDRHLEAVKKATGCDWPDCKFKEDGKCATCGRLSIDGEGVSDG